MVEIRTYRESDCDEVIALVLHCQNDGTRPLVTVEDQPELLCIREKYMENSGNFWVAADGGRIAGSIGLMNFGNGIAVLKKFFVYEPYRSAPHHLGRRLYDEMIRFAGENGIRAIYLDTPKNTDRAHHFYERAGFKKVGIGQIPISYDYPYQDSDFFCLTLD